MKNNNGRFRQSLWVTGEVGDRLTAIRDTELYQRSAHTIKNLLVTELGNLKFAKSYSPTVLDGAVAGTLVKAINTPWDMFIIITTDEILTIRASTNTLLNRLSHSAVIDVSCNVSLIDVFLFVCHGDTTIYEINPTDGAIGVSNFKDSMQLPLHNRGFVTFDVYQVRTIDSVTKPYLVRTTNNLGLEKKTGKLYIKDTDYEIKRVYFPYQADLITIDIAGLTAGDWIISVRSFEESALGTFHCGNKSFALTGKTTDTSGEWYNNADLIDGDKGKWDYGEIRQIDTGMIDVIEHQDRLIVLHGSEVYMSKVGDYNNFVNDVNDADPFYYRPSQIRGEHPTLLKAVAGRGLYVVTDRGVFLTGYNQTITPTIIDNKLVTDEPCTSQCVIVDDLLYFLTTTYDIMGIENISQEKGVVDFKAFFVEKYDTSKDIRYLKFARVGGENYCLALDGVQPVGRLYKNLNLNQYSRTSIDLPANIVNAVKDDLVSKDTHYEQSVNNMKTATLKMNPPHLETHKGGFYLNDMATKFYRVVMRLLDEDNQAVDYVKIAGYTLNRLGDSIAGVYSVYKLEEGSSIREGIDIEINSNENDKTLEIQATEIFYNVGAD